jgi:hypothetical protein
LTVIILSLVYIRNQKLGLLAIRAPYLNREKKLVNPKKCAIFKNFMKKMKLATPRFP